MTLIGRHGDDAEIHVDEQNLNEDTHYEPEDATVHVDETAYHEVKAEIGAAIERKKTLTK